MMLRASLVVLTTLITFTAHAECTRDPIALDLPAQPMNQALAQLAMRSGCAIPSAQRITETAPAVSGTYRPEEALWALLQDSGWEGYPTRDGLEVSKREQRRVHAESAALRERIAANEALSPDERQRYLAELEAVEQSVVQLAREQGFISAAEKASYRRSFEQLEAALRSPAAG
ncbi:hypothetical protein ACGK9R_07185 [Halomonas sp. HNIBRBA4712]|uniref:hypothetical protein n=1 Tax=Halomonas sp. HNIBRBA4712 TaxID=3373087 RepID=UPI003745B193